MTNAMTEEASLPPPSADGLSFAYGPAHRPVQANTDPLMQWAAGLATAARGIYTGWLIAKEQSAELDLAMTRAGYEPIDIKHTNGIVTHWSVGEADCFVIAQDVQSMVEMRATTDRYGIAYAWRTLEDGRRQSKLAMRVLLRSLLEVGYRDPLLVTVKSTLTSDLLAALTRQYDVLDAAEQLKGQQYPYYAFSLPLAPAADFVRRGNGGQQKEIVPMVAAVPEPIDAAYLKAHWIGKQPWVRRCEELLPATLAWSIDYSERIAAGEQG